MKLLLVDAMTWDPEAPTDHPFRQVSHWFDRHLEAELSPDDWRVIAGDQASADDLEGIDGVIVTGSPRNAFDEDAFNDHLMGFLRTCRSHAVPLLGVCFGAQLLARALGGRVGRNTRGYEIGTCDVNLTDAGAAHPLFAGLDRTLRVIQSHRDHIVELPPDATWLGTGDHTGYQAFACDEGRMVGVQFHPEMDPAVLQFLWQRRRLADPHRSSDALQSALDEATDTPAGPRILRNFVHQMVEPDAAVMR